jgi:hypothetical protein
MVRYHMVPDLRLDSQIRRSLPLLLRRGSGKLPHRPEQPALLGLHPSLQLD